MFSFYKTSFFLLFLIILSINPLDSKGEETFDSWLTSYKKFVLSKGVSKKTIDLVFKDAKYLEKVIVLEVDDKDIIDRMSGRRVHMESGRVYHILFNPPKNEGLDDMTNEKLFIPNEYNKLTESWVNLFISSTESIFKLLIKPFDNLRKSSFVNSFF